MDATAQHDTARAFYLIVAIFVAAQVFKFIFLVPEAETGGDAAMKWNVARELAQGSAELFRGSDFISQHYMRWASWALPMALIWLFSDEIVIYYLSTALPSTLAALIFVYVSFRNFGPVPTLVLAILWFFDPQLYRATFQLLPTGAGLLPLALIVLTFQRFGDGKLSDRGLTIWLVVLLFWLYGAKETNIFFAPGLFFAIWLLSRAKYAFGFALGFVALYAVEAVGLSLLADKALLGGRMMELLAGGAVHITAMREAEVLVREQEALWDAGILSRWYNVSPFHIPVYALSIPAFIYLVVRHIRTPPETGGAKLAFGVAMMALSFVLLTSFFIVSLDPVRLGQPLRSRYLAILLPLSYFTLFHMFMQISNRRAAVRSVVALVLLSLTFSIGDLAIRGRLAADLGPKVKEAVLFGDSQPLPYWTAYYAWFGKVLPRDRCTPEKLDRRRNSFKRMYVSRNNRGPGYFARIEDCAPVEN